MRHPAPLLMLVAFFALAFCSCTKFDEGPAFSLRTKTFRATNNWINETATRNGIDVTGTVRINAKLKSEGQLVYKDTIDGATTALEGAWEFDHSGENLLLVFTNPGGGVISAKIWHVVRLTTDELWVTEQIGSDLYRYEFIPK